MIIKKILNLASGKYDIYIGDKIIRVYEKVLIDLNILKPGKYPDELIYKIIGKNNYYELLYQMKNYLNRKMRSEKEVIVKLKRLNASNNDIESIIKTLKEDGSLDSDKYIHSYINDQINLTLNGPKKIIKDLTSKGYDSFLINNILENISDDIWNIRIKKIISKKQKVLKNESLKMLKLKIKKELYDMGYEDVEFDLDINQYDESSSKEAIISKLNKKYKNLDEKTREYKIKQYLKQKGFDNSFYE